MVDEERRGLGISHLMGRNYPHKLDRISRGYVSHCACVFDRVDKISEL